MRNRENDQIDGLTEGQDRVESEALLRRLERSAQETIERTPDRFFIDDKGRAITIQNSEYNSTMYAEARDTSNGLNPRVGTITASLEEHNADRRVRIHNVEVIPSYRNVGIGSELLQRVEDYAQRNGAREIYGLVVDDEARSFWEAQSKNGWELVDNGTKVRKRL